MSQTYEIAWVGDRTREWQSQHGLMVDYRIALEDRDGTLTLTQKPSTDPPRVGQELFGHIEEEEVTPRNGDPFTAYKFKKDQQPNGSSPREQLIQRNAEIRDKQRAGGDPFADKDARIERMAAHKVAATLASTYPAAEQQDEFTKWLDFLSADLDSYEKARGLRGAAEPAKQPEEVAVETVKAEFDAEEDPFASVASEYDD